MAKRQIFYSFHFKDDVMRVQLVRNMGAIEGNEPTTKNKWEKLKRKGDKSIKKWINDNMKHCSCVVVLIGSDTASRKWVKYEIKKAWSKKKGVVGIYIHNMKDPKRGISSKGKNPFKNIKLKDGKGKLSSVVKCHNPKSSDSYNIIKNKIHDWIEEAITIRKKYK